jgi:hypothetical protein
MLQSLRTLAVPVVAISLVGGAAHADRRAFTHTYEYMTMPDGDTELEFYNTHTRPEMGEDRDAGFEWQLEIEHGLTERWDLSLYTVFAQDAAEGAPFRYDATKLRTRYRFSERGMSVLDTLLYFEVAKQFGENTWEFEPKLVLARDFGKFTAAANAIGEVELEEEVEMSTGNSEMALAFEPGWAAGLTYEAVPQFKLGLETYGAVESPGDENEVEAWAGPALSWAPSPRLWLATTAAFGLTGHSDELVMRFILGLGL